MVSAAFWSWRTTPKLAGQLAEQLTTCGYQVDLAAEALNHGAACDHAVIPIERMLPDIDGIAVMRQLRDEGVAAPFLILIISALGEVDDKVRRLPAGGDDLSGQAFLLPRAVGATGSA
jgi:two-component system, OmpR family, response regulator